MSADKALRFYLLAVCFVAMVCAAITAGMLFYGVVKIAAPELTLDTWSYSAHQSLENFRRSQFNPENTPRAALLARGPGSAQAIALDPEVGVTDPAQRSRNQPLGDEELEQKRRESFQQVLRNHQRGALQDLIRLSIVLLVSAALFYTHWRMARKHSAAAQ
jgi:hypothetical protein